MARGARWWAAMALAGALAAGATGCGTSAGRHRPLYGYAVLDAVPEQLAADKLTIVVGDPDAPATVHLYEDPRCPYCREFELTGGGLALNEWLLGRKAKAQYTLASFLDGRLGGKGSKKAVNALRAALDEGKFAEYHAILYQNQPAEDTDDFTDAHLLELASRVEGLRGRRFDDAVATMKYRDFVTASQKAYERAGTGRTGPGTPTAEINGTRIPMEYNGVLYDRTAFTSVLENARGANPSY